MIKIERSESPQRLVDNPDDVNRYNHKDVVSALWNMQNEKCCYCEMSISSEGHGKAVEHFAPQSVFTAQRNDWDNLLLACAQCNGKKGDKYPVVPLTRKEDEPKVLYLTKPRGDGSALILNPCDLQDDPEQHLGFHTNYGKPKELGLIKAPSNSTKGRVTIEVLGLDRAWYTGKHGDWLINLMRDYTLLLMADKVRDINEIRRQKALFTMYVSAKYEYTAISRVFVRKMELDINFGISIPIGAGV